MKLIRLLTREEPIAGLSVSDASVRLMLLERIGMKDNKIAIRAIAEEGLPEGAIVAGKIKDEKIVLDALKTLLESINVPIKYVVLSLPMDNIYSRVFKFPSSLKGDKLNEAMKTGMGFNIPLGIDEVYLDWENIDAEKPVNEICLAVMPKSIVNEYMDTLNKVNIKIVAVESHALSMMRSIKINKEKPILIATRSGAAPTIFITKNRAVKFTHVLAPDLSEDHIDSEIKKISYYYETKGEPVENTLSYKGLELGDKFAAHALIKDGHHHKWVSTVGAALRGLISRREDNLISLLPVGTEKAYEYQKAIVFAEFLSNALVGLSVFFILAFTGGWIIMNSLQLSLNKQTDLSNLPLPIDAVAIEERALQFNKIVREGLTVAQSLPKWSIFLEDLRTRIPGGISVSTLTVPSIESQITMNGSALNRGVLNQFKKGLDEWDFITETRLPLTDLEKREDIPFSISFKIKDPSKIYK